MESLAEKWDSMLALPGPPWAFIFFHFLSFTFIFFHFLFSFFFFFFVGCSIYDFSGSQFRYGFSGQFL